MDATGYAVWQAPPEEGLYDPAHERDACGVGFVAHLDGTPSHELVAQAASVLSNLAHRGAVGGDAASGDGAGILTQLPDKLFRQAGEGMPALPPPGAYGVGMFFLPRFVKVFPMDYRRALGRMTREDEATLREELPHG